MPGLRRDDHPGTTTGDDVSELLEDEGGSVQVDGEDGCRGGLAGRDTRGVPVISPKLDAVSTSALSEVVVVIGAGSIGQAVARRVSAGKHVVLADLRLENADAAAEVMLDAGFDVSTATVDVSSRQSVQWRPPHS
jgi:Saccharopine dehydrogenase NADP binding domain